MLDGEFPAISSIRPWKQLHGGCRRYEHDSIFAANGEFYNGICMYFFRPNECFVAPITEEIQVGRSYPLSMKRSAWKEKCIVRVIPILQRAKKGR